MGVFTVEASNSTYARVRHEGPDDYDISFQARSGSLPSWLTDQVKQGDRVTVSITFAAAPDAPPAAEAEHAHHGHEHPHESAGTQPPD